MGSRYGMGGMGMYGSRFGYGTGGYGMGGYGMGGYGMGGYGMGGYGMGGYGMGGMEGGPMTPLQRTIETVSRVSGVMDMMVESLHMSISSFMELAGRLGYASHELHALGTTISFMGMLRSMGRWIWSLPKDSFGLFLRLLAVLLAWAGFRFWKRKSQEMEEMKANQMANEFNGNFQQQHPMDPSAAMGYPGYDVRGNQLSAGYQAAGRGMGRGYNAHYPTMRQGVGGSRGAYSTFPSSTGSSQRATGRGRASVERYDNSGDGGEDGELDGASAAWQQSAGATMMTQSEEDGTSRTMPFSQARAGAGRGNSSISRMLMKSQERDSV
ncbi:hypothetical protein GUITHDRAFT_151849, partial [Guillardia theta CCMP2712]